jgi:hypothetical protein
MTTEAAVPVSVFADRAADLFTIYDVSITFTDKVMGGVPKDPKIIEGWLRAKAGLTDDVEELRQATLRTLTELGLEVKPDMTWEQIEEASASLAAEKQTNGFKRDTNGLYLEERQVKAMLKESTNILFAAERWGKTKKGPKSFLAERVFVKPDRIYLDRTEPDGVDLFIGHVSGPQGRRSTITYIEYVERATATLRVLSTKDELGADEWGLLWAHAEKNGLGALRSQGHGQFVVTKWDRV